MKTIVTITDSEGLAIALDRYLRCTFNDDIESYYMTYRNKSAQLSGALYKQADLFIIEMFRTYDCGLRAEAIPVVENLWGNGKKAVIVCGSAKGENIRSSIYWDLGSRVSFSDMIKGVVTQEINVEEELGKLKDVFKEYCFTPSHHRHRHAVSSLP
ncbi:MAG: hypothetical protein KAR13_07810 [Desulfobulbaceae bacterium]|nr:hypothetical protein [Desulfobulbaceae bacterium]